MKAFIDLGLSQPVVDAIEKLGFEEPTPIQSQAIPRLLEEEVDFIGLAQTGTGKTAAFGLPLIERADLEFPHIQALVLAPTRELCLQITRELGQFGRFRKGINIQAVYGGTSITAQIRALRNPPQILVATPGRLRDLMQRKALKLLHLRQLVLDEADEMLNMGFKQEIDDILRYTPAEKQTWLFSATMPPEVRRISESYMENPFELTVGTRNASNADIDHQYVLVRPSDRFEALKRFLDVEEDIYCLVFCRTRRDTSEIAEMLNRDGYRSDALHGDLDQRQRDRVMDRFRKQKIRILVATDVAARGIDVDNITHVFHYNIPEDMNFYNHRSGRTGRAGSKGISLILAHPKDQGLIRTIERRLRVSFSQTSIPFGIDIFEKKINNYFKKVSEITPRPEAQLILPQVEAELEDLTKSELLEKLISLRIKKMDRHGQSGRDLNVRSRREARETRTQKRYEGKFDYLFINVGSMDVGNIGDFIAFLSTKSKIPGSALGKINMSRQHTFFEIEEEYSQQLKRSFQNAEMEGRPLRINQGNNSPKGRKRDKFKKKKKKWKG